MTYLTSQKHCDFHGFCCTYEVITAGSCEQGEALDHGYLDRYGEAVDEAYDSHWDLQDLSRLSGYRFEGDGAKVPRWLTCEAGISIHRPDWCTDASWLRVLKLLGWSYRY